MDKRRIRVLVVDDILAYADVLCQGLGGDPAIEVVGNVRRVNELTMQPQALHADVMILSNSGSLNDILFFIKRHPQCACIVLGASKDMEKDALHAGAGAFFVRIERQRDPVQFLLLVGQLKAAVKRIVDPAAAAASRTNNRPLGREPAGVWEGSFQTVFAGIIAMGASAGGTEAISRVLRMLPDNMPPIIIVQHMPPVFTKVYAERLDAECHMSVREACDGDELVTGTAMVAPGGKQTCVQRREGRFYVTCREGMKVSGHCPSVDLLFESVARQAGRKAVGIILTGMGHDGAKGLLAMRSAGAYTLGQDEGTSMVYGMPGVAQELGAVVKQQPLDQIAPHLLSYLQNL